MNRRRRRRAGSGGLGGAGVPANALLDDNGTPITDDLGNYLLTDV